MNKTTLLIFVFIFVLGSSVMGAFPLPTTEPCRWDGSVSIDGSPATDVTVEGYVNDVQQKTYTVGENSLYTMTLGGITGDEVAFEVGGVPAETDTFEAYGTRTLDLAVTKQADGATCTSAAVCISGVCDGGTCGTTAPAPGPAGGGGGTGGGGGGGGGSSSGFTSTTDTTTDTETTNTGTPGTTNNPPIIRDVFDAEDQGPLFSGAGTEETTPESTATPLTGAAVADFFTKTPTGNGLGILIVLVVIAGIVFGVRKLNKT